jgi:hypothetical protein
MPYSRSFPEAKQDHIVRVGTDLTIHLKCPPASIYESSDVEMTPSTGLFEVITICIDKVFSGDEQVSLDGDDLKEFLDSLDVPTFRKINDFIADVPRVEHTIKYKNSLGRDRYRVYNSLEDFFTLAMTGRELFDYYKSAESLVAYGWSIADLDNIKPYEKDFYSGLILNRQREKQQAAYG